MVATTLQKSPKKGYRYEQWCGVGGWQLARVRLINKMSFVES
jgi:hypothetical protein